MTLFLMHPIYTNWQLNASKGDKTMKKRSVLITIATILCLTLSIGMISMASESNNFNSRGKIVFDNSTSDTSDDVIFDASDITTINTMITDGKGQLAASLGNYPNTNVAALDTFANLSSAIDSLTVLPSEKYYYDSTTGTDDATTLVRYIKENGSYYLCNQYGEKTSDEAQSVDENNLVEYTQMTQENLTAGTAGMVDKTFVLGNGSDNINYRNLGKDEILGNISVYLKSASSTQTVEMNKHENRTLRYTFSDLSNVLGVSYYTQSGDNSIMTKSISISGNVVSITVYNDSSVNTPLTCKSSVTVIGY